MANTRKKATNQYVKPTYSDYIKRGTYKLDLPLLKQVLSYQARSYDHTRQFKIIGDVYDILLNKGIKAELSWDKFGNAFIEKKTHDGIPIGVVAHVDQVHNHVDNYKIFGEDLLFAMDMDSGLQVGTGGKIILN